MDEYNFKVAYTEFRANIYKFLAYVYSQNPNAAFIKYLSGDAFRTQLKVVGELFGNENENKRLKESLTALIAALTELAEDPDALTKLQEDYTRLLRGIHRGRSPLPPYESAYRAGYVMSEHVVDVLKQYRMAGLKIIEKGEPPDHIGFELEFMSNLCRLEAECVKANDERGAEKFALMQRQFLEEHLLIWVPDFCKNVLEYDSKFYGAISRFTNAWLEWEKCNLLVAQD
jgi:TorA maturation chaperone TorD